MYKVHGTKNTFYILKDRYTEKEKIETAIKLCQDGTDGVMYICKSDVALSKMRIFNADGSEPEMCGNGLRCFSRVVLEANNLKVAQIETMNAIYDVKLVDDFYGMVGVEIKLYPVKALDNEYADLLTESYNQSFKFYTVSNPHVVTEGLYEEEELIAMGKKSNETFPKGVNLNTVTVLNDHEIFVRTFERGVGITASCGTGMTSSSLDFALKRDYFNKKLTVYNDGGLIWTEVRKKDGDYEVLFTGNATLISEHKDEVVLFDEDDKYDLFLDTITEHLSAYDIKVIKKPS